MMYRGGGGALSATTMMSMSMSQNAFDLNGSQAIPTTTSAPPIMDFTELDEGLKIWGELLPFIEKHVECLSNVAEEMLTTAGDHKKFAEPFLDTAVRYHATETKAVTGIKEIRKELKKTVTIKQQPTTSDDGAGASSSTQQQQVSKQKKAKKQKAPGNPNNSSDDDDDEEEDDDEDMDTTTGAAAAAAAVMPQEIEVPALSMELIEEVEEKMGKIIRAKPDASQLDMDSDVHYRKLGQCIDNMRGEDDEEDGEDEDGVNSSGAQAVGHVASSKCPLTQKKFVTPVQNKRCKHKYEKDAVLAYIADKTKRHTGKGAAKVMCPVGGCKNVLDAKDLKAAV